MRRIAVIALVLFSISISDTSLFAQDDAMALPDAKQQAAAKIFAGKSSFGNGSGAKTGASSPTGAKPGAAASGLKPKTPAVVKAGSAGAAERARARAAGAGPVHVRCAAGGCRQWSWPWGLTGGSSSNWPPKRSKTLRWTSGLGTFLRLNMSPEQALLLFPDYGAVQQVADGKRPYPADPLLAAVYEVQVTKLVRQTDSRKPDAQGNVPPEPTDAEKAAEKQAGQATAARIAGELFSLAKNQRMAALIKMPVDDRIAFTTYVGGDQKNLLLADWNPRERELFQAMAVGRRRLVSHWRRAGTGEDGARHPERAAVAGGVDRTSGSNHFQRVHRQGLRPVVYDGV